VLDEVLCFCLQLIQNPKNLIPNEKSTSSKSLRDSGIFIHVLTQNNTLLKSTTLRFIYPKFQTM